MRSRCGKKTWNLKRFRFIRRQACFIIRRIASYGEAVLHKTPFQTWHGVAKRRRLKHCSRLHFITPRQAISFRYEASPLRSDMMRKWKMRVYPFAIQRYPHYIMTCNPVLYGWIFCLLILLAEPIPEKVYFGICNSAGWGYINSKSFALIF